VEALIGLNEVPATEWDDPTAGFEVPAAIQGDRDLGPAEAPGKPDRSVDHPSVDCDPASAKYRHAEARLAQEGALDECPSFGNFATVGLNEHRVVSR
jgi:hypothetical protein